MEQTAIAAAVESVVKYPARPGYPIEWREVDDGSGQTELRSYYPDKDTDRLIEATWAPQ